MELSFLISIINVKTFYILITLFIYYDPIIVERLVISLQKKIVIMAITMILHIIVVVLIIMLIIVVILFYINTNKLSIIRSFY